MYLIYNVTKSVVRIYIVISVVVATQQHIFNNVRNLGITRALQVNQRLRLQIPITKTICYHNNILMECSRRVPDTMIYQLPSSSRNTIKKYQQLYYQKNNILHSKHNIQNNNESLISPALNSSINNSTSTENTLSYRKYSTEVAYISSDSVESVLEKVEPRLVYKVTDDLNTTEKNLNLLHLKNVKQPQQLSLLENFIEALENFNRLFYVVTFDKLTPIVSESRRENGMSFVQSGLLLYIALTAFSTEVNTEARDEIDQILKFNASNLVKTDIIKQLVSLFPNASNDIKFNWSSRLVLGEGSSITKEFQSEAAAAMQLRIDRLNGTEDPTAIADTLNKMIEGDSGGAIHDTFDEYDFTEPVEAVLITTMYLRARWRSAPTLLNGTHVFHDSDHTQHTVRMIKINDVMNYADLQEWNAEVIEIFYFTKNLSLLIFVPKENSIRNLTYKVADVNIGTIIAKMKPMRVTVTLPLYTLRMTLLLPNKLQAMGISRLLNNTHRESLCISHAIQRLMFWAEAGRNAYKDDGLEWDEPSELQVTINRPYIFYVRWKNLTLMNGNFVM